jgi:hypothetical protein
VNYVDFERALALAWPWAAPFKRQLRQLRAKPFGGSHLLFGSDYSGDHSANRFRVYGFVIADADASPKWPARCREVRRSFLVDGRRMSFKNLNDRHRRRALVPFLEAAEFLDGHVVAVAVTKDLERLSTSTNTLDIWENLHGLQARWDARWFEQMVRVAHLFSLFLAAWSSPGMNVSWVTDNDSIVANDGRLGDMHQLTARFFGLYVPQRLGEFMMNTVAVDSEGRSFEDFVAIPDLADGMLAEVLSGTTTDEPSHKRRLWTKELSEKSEIIADWFRHRGGSCTCSPRANAGVVSCEAELTRPEAAAMMLNDSDFFALKIGRAEPVGNITTARSRLPPASARPSLPMSSPESPLNPSDRPRINARPSCRNHSKSPARAILIDSHSAPGLIASRPLVC